MPGPRTRTKQRLAAARLFHAWGQDPRRPGRAFESLETASEWARAEAPQSCGFAFVENSRTHEITVFRAQEEEPFSTVAPLMQVAQIHAGRTRRARYIGWPSEELTLHLSFCRRALDGICSSSAFPIFATDAAICRAELARRGTANAAA